MIKVITNKILIVLGAAIYYVALVGFMAICIVGACIYGVFALGKSAIDAYGAHVNRHLTAEDNWGKG
jgi:hypothetical protein